MGKFLSFLTGCGAGIMAAIVLTPRPGQKLRDTISNKAPDELQGGILRVVGKSVERGRNVVSFARGRVNAAVDREIEFVNESIESGKSRMSEAMDVDELLQVRRIRQRHRS